MNGSLRLSETGVGAVAEFIATFTLVFIGAGAVVLYANGVLDITGVALAQGLALAVMISVTAHLSAGLVNPAVATALWVTGKIHGSRALAYMVAELGGAVLGALLLKSLVPRQLFEAAGGGTPTLGPGIAAGKGVLIEATLTFFLVFAVFGTAVDRRGPYAKTAGLTIGLVLAFDILAFFPYTGAAANPARWFGPALVTGRWDDWYVWIVGPIAGGVLAGVVYWVTFLRDGDTPSP